MPTRAATKKRVAVKGVGWKKPMFIVADTYRQVSKVILAVLTAEPIRFTELARLVGKRLPGFEGPAAERSSLTTTGIEELSPMTPDDLAVVCANCHAMIHSNPKRALPMDVIRQLWATSKGVA